jgi:hypothetical protein
MKRYGPLLLSKIPKRSKDLSSKPQLDSPILYNREVINQQAYELTTSPIRDIRDLVLITFKDYNHRREDPTRQCVLRMLCSSQLAMRTRARLRNEDPVPPCANYGKKGKDT